MYYIEFVVSVDLLKMILLFNCTRASYQNTEKNSNSLKYLKELFFFLNETAMETGIVIIDNNPNA